MSTCISSRKHLVLAVLLLALSVFAITATGCSSQEGFSVSQVQGDPLAFSGEITMNGTVSAFSDDDPNLFAVMDTDELMQCGRFDCGAWQMPTLFVGLEGLPVINQGDNVVMTGEFTQFSDMVVFQANNVTVGNNIMNRLP